MNNDFPMNTVGKDRVSEDNKGKITLTKGQEDAVKGLVEFINAP